MSPVDSSAGDTSGGLAAVAVNLLGVVEHPVLAGEGRLGDNL